MSNVISNFFSNVAKGIEEAVSFVGGIAGKVQKIVADEKAITPGFVSTLTALVADVESFVASAASATSAGVVNFEADSVAYNAALKIIADFKPFATEVEAAIAILKKDA